MPARTRRVNHCFYISEPEICSVVFGFLPPHVIRLLLLTYEAGLEVILPALTLDLGPCHNLQYRPRTAAMSLGTFCYVQSTHEN